MATTEVRVPSRMKLGATIKGRQEAPKRTLVIGVEGVGKSTFASNAPSPIFLCSEDGTAQLDIERFPAPQTWTEVLEAVSELTVAEHPHRTLVIDTLDWAEPMLWAHICERDKQDNIEAYGYGKGYVAALDEWRILIAALERMRATKKMEVVMLAHSWIKPFKNPEGQDFDRYEMKLHPKASGLIKEWCDNVLFANFETFATKDPKTKRVKGVSSGARLLYTTRTAAYDAKNRYDLPESLPLDWGEYAAACVAHQPADPKELAEQIRIKAGKCDETTKAQALALLEQHANNAAALAKINDRLNAKLSERSVEQ